MDPFSGEEELLTITTLFHTHAHEQVLAYDTSPLSSSNVIYAQSLQNRSRIALGQAKDVLASMSQSSSENRDPASIAIKSLALHTLGDQEEDGVEMTKELAEQEAENSIVQVVCGTVLASAGLFDEAKTLLSKHDRNLEAVALLTQIHLIQNQTDLALKEVQAAKQWAQDSLLINLAEAWVGLRVGGDSYQSAYYVYEELSSASNSTTSSTLTSQAVADMHLNRLPEAETALNQALEMDPKNRIARANQIVLACLMGKKWSVTAEELLNGLRESGGNATQDVSIDFAGEIEEMDRKFEEAKEKYDSKVVMATA